jgi:IS6 family transposase
MNQNHSNGSMRWVTWYSRYALSYRDLREIAAERGFILNHSTIYRWVQEYAMEIKKRIKPHKNMVGFVET